MKDTINVDAEYLTHLHRELDLYRKGIWQRSDAQEAEYQRLTYLYEDARKQITVFKKHTIKELYAMCLVDFIDAMLPRRSIKAYHR